MSTTKQTWFEEMIEGLSAIHRLPDGSIPSEPYCAAIARIPGIYDTLFGNLPPVVSTLRADIDNGVLRVRNACAAAPDGKGNTLQAMCDHLLATVGVEAVRADCTSGVRCLLWLNRASTFIMHLIKGILDGDEPHVAADKAYVTYLQPWHGYILGTFVQSVMYAAPPKEKMFRYLELPSEEEALRQMREYVRLMEPICTDILAYMEKNGCNWPDKA